MLTMRGSLSPSSQPSQGMQDKTSRTVEMIIYSPQSFLGPMQSQDATLGAGRATAPRKAIRQTTATTLLISSMPNAYLTAYKMKPAGTWGLGSICFREVSARPSHLETAPASGSLEALLADDDGEEVSQALNSAHSAKGVYRRLQCLVRRKQCSTSAKMEGHGRTQLLHLLPPFGSLGSTCCL